MEVTVFFENFANADFSKDTLPLEKISLVFKSGKLIKITKDW